MANIAHSKEIIEILSNNKNKFNDKLINLLLNTYIVEKHYYESLLRLLRTFALNNIFIADNLEDFIGKIDLFMFNDVCIQYILSNLILITSNTQ